MSAEPPTIPRVLLKPYVSMIVLTCPGDASPEAAFSQVLVKLSEPGVVGTSRASAQVIASGLDEPQSGPESRELDSIDQHAVLVYRVESKPSWLKDPLFVDINHEVAILLRMRHYVVVHVPTRLRSAIQTWLDRAPRPILKRVPASIFEQALLRGESRGLWLKGTHARRKSKADSKNIAGVDLRQSLSPIEDQTYTLNSARSVLEVSEERAQLAGPVGTTPSSSLVWTKQSPGFDVFVACARGLVELIDEAWQRDADRGAPIFPLLTQPVQDFKTAWGAYEIGYANPDDLPAESVGDSIINAAAVLDHATLAVIGRPDSPDFDIEVGLNGSIGGLVHARILAIDERAKLSISLASGASDPEMAEPVTRALRHSELITVHYASGHTFTQQTFYKPHVEPRPFPNWRWSDFTGHDIWKEKPGEATWPPERIHAGIGALAERSLFSWVQRHYSQGWLTCDDGPGEVADFVHVDSDGTLRLIHVKAAKSRGTARAISATAFEVVVSQAVKNSIFLDPDLLLAHLSECITGRATWTNGTRAPDRRELIEMIEARDARDRSEVVIVQPHVAKPIYDRLYQADAAAAESPDLLRLRRLETILNSGRPAMTGRGSDLAVESSMG